MPTTTIHGSVVDVDDGAVNGGGGHDAVPFGDQFALMRSVRLPLSDMCVGSGRVRPGMSMFQ